MHCRGHAPARRGAAQRRRDCSRAGRSGAAVPSEMAPATGADQGGRAAGRIAERHLAGYGEQPGCDHAGAAARVEVRQVFGKHPLVVVLDRLQDPGNVGTIVRAAEAFGVPGSSPCPARRALIIPRPCAPRPVRCSECLMFIRWMRTRSSAPSVRMACRYGRPSRPVRQESGAGH